MVLRSSFVGKHRAPVAFTCIDPVDAVSVDPINIIFPLILLTFFFLIHISISTKLISSSSPFTDSLLKLLSFSRSTNLPVNLCTLMVWFDGHRCFHRHAAHPISFFIPLCRHHSFVGKHGAPAVFTHIDPVDAVSADPIDVLFLLILSMFFFSTHISIGTKQIPSLSPFTGSLLKL